MTSRSANLAFWTLCAFFALWGVARAQEAAAPSVFQAHRDQARDLYRAGRYEDAMEELRAAYAIKPDPKLLLNLGHVHLRLERPQDALRYYTRYRDLRPDLSPQEAAELDGYMAQARARVEALRPPPPPLFTPPPPRPLPPPPPPQKTPTPPPLSRRPWLWVTVGAVAVASATAVTLGVLLPRAGSSALDGVEIRDVDPGARLLSLRF